MESVSTLCSVPHIFVVVNLCVLLFCRVALGVKEVGFWQQKAKKLEMDVFEKDRELEQQVKKQLAEKTNYERMTRERTASVSATTYLDAKSRSNSLVAIGGRDRTASIATIGSIGKPPIKTFSRAPNVDPSNENYGDMTAEQEEFMVQMTDSIIQKLKSENARKDTTINRLTGQLAQSRGYPLLTVMKNMPEEQVAARIRPRHEDGRGTNTIENLLQTYYDDKDHDELFDYDKFLREDNDDISRNSEEMREFDVLKNYKVNEYNSVRKDPLRRSTREEYRSTSTLSTHNHSQRHSQDNPNHIDNRPSSAPNVIKTVRDNASFKLEKKEVSLLMRKGSRISPKAATVGNPAIERVCKSDNFI